MKRILIIALASIFLVNMLGIFGHALKYETKEVIINEKNFPKTIVGSNYNGYFDLSYNKNVMIDEIYRDKEFLFDVNLDFPYNSTNYWHEIDLTNRVIPGQTASPAVQIKVKIYLDANKNVTSIETSSNYAIDIIEYQTNDNILTVKYKNLRRTYNGSNDFYGALTGVRYHSQEYMTTTLTLEEDVPCFKSYYLEQVPLPEPGDILINNISDAPKDVLREVVAVLPVLIGILIAYIATRKGITFIRYILESA